VVFPKIPDLIKVKHFTSRFTWVYWIA